MIIESFISHVWKGKEDARPNKRKSRQVIYDQQVNAKLNPGSSDSTTIRH